MEEEFLVEVVRRDFPDVKPHVLHGEGVVWRAIESAITRNAAQFSSQVGVINDAGGSNPEAPQGWHLRIRLAPSRRPAPAPCVQMASAV